MFYFLKLTQISSLKQTRFFKDLSLARKLVKYSGRIRGYPGKIIKEILLNRNVIKFVYPLLNYQYPLSSRLYYYFAHTQKVTRRLKFKWIWRNW